MVAGYKCREKGRKIRNDERRGGGRIIWGKVNEKGEETVATTSRFEIPKAYAKPMPTT